MKKINRVTSNQEFGDIVHNGTAKRNNCYIVHVRENTLGFVRVGISVSKKIGVAVVRNRIKRQVRAMCGELIDFNVCSIDIIIVVKDGFLSNTYQNNKNSLQSLITIFTEKNQ